MIFPDGTPISKPVLVAKEYPAELFQKNDLDALGEIYKASIVELMKQSQCDLLPKVYLHLRCNPFDLEDRGNYLYEMHIDQSGLPYSVLQAMFQRLTRLVATRGEARGVAVLMRAMAYDTNLKTKMEAMVVTVETERGSRAWHASFTECLFHGLHHEPFEQASDDTWRTFPDLMQPLTFNQYKSDIQERIASAGSLDALAEKLGIALEKVRS